MTEKLFVYFFCFYSKVDFIFLELYSNKKDEPNIYFARLLLYLLYSILIQ